MPTLEHAITGLQAALDAPRRQHTWRWLVRNRISAVQEALHEERVRAGDAWLAPREQILARERDRLVSEMHAISRDVAETGDPEFIRQRLRRLVHDLEHHRQRLSDLVYDAVSLELGGEQ